MLDRRLGVGGQVLTLQGLAGVYDDIFLPLYGAHQAQNAACALAAVEAFFGAGAASGPIDVEHRPRGVRRGALARPARDGAHRADRARRRRPQPGRHDGDRRRAERGVRLPPAGRRGRDARRQGRRRRCSTCSSPSSTRSWSPRTRPIGRWTSTSWPRSRSRCSAPTGSPSPSTLPEALEAAFELAEQTDDGSCRARACWSPARWSPPARRARCSGADMTARGRARP